MDRTLKVLVGTLVFLVAAIALFFVPLQLDGRFRPSGFELLMARNDAGVVVSQFKELRSSALPELNQSEWGQSYALGGAIPVYDAAEGGVELSESIRYPLYCDDRLVGVFLTSPFPWERSDRIGAHERFVTAPPASAVLELLDTASVAVVRYRGEGGEASEPQGVWTETWLVTAGLRRIPLDIGGERSVYDLLADPASSRIPAGVWAAVEGTVRFSDPDVRIPINLL